MLYITLKLSSFFSLLLVFTLVIKMSYSGPVVIDSVGVHNEVENSKKKKITSEKKINSTKNKVLKSRINLDFFSQMPEISDESLILRNNNFELENYIPETDEIHIPKTDEPNDLVIEKREFTIEEQEERINVKDDPSTDDQKDINKDNSTYKVENITIYFQTSEFNLSNSDIKKLEILALKLKKGQRITIKAYATSTSTNTSEARRLSLSRALAVRGVFIENNLEVTRLDVKALGSDFGRDPPEDKVEVLIIK